jgi:hypothetical protein
MDGSNIKERVTPPVREKIMDDVNKRVNDTVEKVRQDLDRSGFDSKDREVRRAIRDGVYRTYVDLVD